MCPDTVSSNDHLLIQASVMLTIHVGVIHSGMSPQAMVLQLLSIRG